MEFGVSQRARGKKVWGFSSSDPGRATHRGVVEEPGERVRDGLRLVVVHHRRQVAPARVSADLDHPGAQHDPESQPAQRPHRGPRRRHPCRHCVDAQHRDLSHSGARAFSAGPPRVVRGPASGRARSGCGRERDAARQWTERGLARLARGAGAGRVATRKIERNPVSRSWLSHPKEYLPGAAYDFLRSAICDCLSLNVSFSMTWRAELARLSHAASVKSHETPLICQSRHATRGSSPYQRCPTATMEW